MYYKCKFIVNKYCLNQHIFKKEDLIMCQAGLGQLVTYKMNPVMSADRLNLQSRFFYIYQGEHCGVPALNLFD